MKDLYLTTLYKDFATKINSINTYIKRIEAETGNISQATYAWIGRLKKKYEILDNFQQTRQRAAPSSGFSLEVTQSGTTNNADNADLKGIDLEIADIANQVNYLFKKSQEELNFLVQSHNDLQDLLNNIDDQFKNLFDKM